MNKQITYRNPWHGGGLVGNGPEFYQVTPLRHIVNHRGVDVFYIHRGRFDFVLKGVCISCRAGASEPKKVIDRILDEWSTGESWHGEEVKKHLASCGY